MTDATGVTTSRSYDPAGRIATQTDGAGPGDALRVHRPRPGAGADDERHDDQHPPWPGAADQRRMTAVRAQHAAPQPLTPDR